MKISENQFKFKLKDYINENIKNSFVQFEYINENILRCKVWLKDYRGTVIVEINFKPLLEDENLRNREFKDIVKDIKKKVVEYLEK